MPETTPIYPDEFLKLHPADLADRLQHLSFEEAQGILPELPPALAAAALASSIFVTTVTDVAGFFFFLGLGTLALLWFGA
jgi:hypothetical protein